MRAVVFRSFVLFAALSSLAALAALASLAACAGDDPADPTPIVEAGTDAPLVGDVVQVDADAEIPLGDVCGDGSGLEKDAPWPMRGGCPKRAGVSPNAGPQNATLKWSIPLPAGESSPAIGADRLIWVGTNVPDAGGDVVVLSADGIIQAALHTAAAVRSSPVRSATGLAVIGGNDGALYGVDRFPGGAPGDAGADGGDDGGDDGGSPWPKPARAVFRLALGPISSSPAIGGDGTIYVTTNAGKLVAVAADGSAMKWDAVTNDTLGSSPAIGADGTVYVGSSDRKLYAFTKQGSSKWSFETGGAILGSPVVGGDDTIYVGSSDGKLYALGTDGKLRWSYATGGPITGSACVRAGVVYVGSDDKKLHAISAPDGARRWVYDTLGAVATPVVAVDSTVYVGSADGNLYAITPTGLLYFAVNTKGSIRSAPAIGDDGTLYVTNDKAVVAIGP
jgi:outer membrane protein assembly factor BamB